jgi:hypothetical protein
MKRRLLLAAAATAALPGAARPVELRLRVWRDPNCDCCGGWVEHMRTAGFRVEDHPVASAAPARRMLGIPADLLSCHAAVVGGYALEGHVPATAVKRLSAERPAGVRGLAVPGMPIGSPGMEMPGKPEDTYDVIAFADGAEHRVFMRFRGGREA